MYSQTTFFSSDTSITLCAVWAEMSTFPLASFSALQAPLAG